MNRPDGTENIWQTYNGKHLNDFEFNQIMLKFVRMKTLTLKIVSRFYPCYPKAGYVRVSSRLSGKGILFCEGL